MKKLFPIMLLLLGLISAKSHAQFPTDEARIYLITASPGNETYSVFGHSALRVYNPAQGYDIVFNYGTFDFQTEHFYIKFGTGKLLYFLSIADYDLFKNIYQTEGQALYLQELNLSPKEKNNLINKLMVNLKEENKYFRYDFFRDNCATRIRDIVTQSLEGKIVYDTTYVEKREGFRKLVGHCLVNQPWTYMGLNLIMGQSGDSIASLTDYMYLPVHLKNLFQTAKVIEGDSIRLLTQAPVELFPSTIISPKPAFFNTPVAFFSLILMMVLLYTFWEIRTNKYFKLPDLILFFISGSIGLLITWLWGWSLHIYLHHNLNIMWASPVNLLAVIGLFFIRKQSWIRYYFLIFGGVLLLYIPCSLFLDQYIDRAVYPIMAILVVRSFRIFFIRTK